MPLGRLGAMIAIAAGAALTAHAVSRLHLLGGVLGQLELETLDYRVRASAQPPRERSEIVLVLFDSAQVARWPYLSPFPRAALAELVDAAARGGARAIGLDVHLDRLYPELDVFGPGDARLREAMQRAGNVVLAGATRESDQGRIPLPPHPYFASAAAGVGVADLPTPFETVRDAVLTVETTQGRVPGFALALYAQARGLSADSLVREAERSKELRVGNLPSQFARLTGGAATQVLPILFVGPPSRPGRDDGAFVAVSGSHAALFPELFRDKVVLLGTGFHEEDLFRSPFYQHQDSTGTFYGWTNGVEVHANALENLLTGHHPVPMGMAAVLALLLGLAFVVASITFLTGAAWGGAAAILIWVGLVAGSFFAFLVGALHVPVVASTLSIAFAFLGSTGYISMAEGREKRMIRGAFAKYVSPAVVDQLIADPSRLRLGGEKRVASVLFSDLAGFTALSEQTDPERLLALLNRYLDGMVEVLLEERGTLDKYIGDAVMALFGAPIPQPDHALRACRTALRMQRRLRALNQEWAGEGWPELHMRIGINTGTPVIGNIGGATRFDYTALGDAVNLAARLEPACKQYGVEILISEFTREAAGDAIVVRELDQLAVYGRRNSVRVYELVALAGEPLGVKRELLERFERGLAAYRRREFERGVEFFESAAELDVEDGPTRLYLARSREYAATAPPDHWDGIERSVSK